MGVYLHLRMHMYMLAICSGSLTQSLSLSEGLSLHARLIIKHVHMIIQNVLYRHTHKTEAAAGRTHCYTLIVLKMLKPLRAVVTSTPGI